MTTPVPQAGGIVVRTDGDRLSVLLVRAKRDPTVWIFPKGHIEEGETPAETALRETREEAGVEGKIVGPVGEPLEFHNGRDLVRVEYFAIAPGTESAGEDGREKRWFSLDEAMTALSWESSRELLKLAVDLINPQKHENAKTRR